jgi:hypothetical protein
MTPEQAVQAAADIDAEVRYRHQLAREAYEAGRQAGYRQHQAAHDARWRQTPGIAVPVGPGHAELEARRWGPGGREHFADPRPGDYPGQHPRRPQPEPEMEAAP